MSHRTQLVHEFVEKLESHPNGANIISIVQEIFEKPNDIPESTLISQLKLLSENNLALLEDLWILRASIFQEEMNLKKMWQVLQDCASWIPFNPKRIERVIQVLIDSEQYLKATFLFQKYNLNSNAEYQEDYDLVMKCLIHGLSLPPGIRIDHEKQGRCLAREGVANSNNVSEIGSIVKNEKSSKISLDRDSNEKLKKESIQVSERALNNWDQARECYEEGVKKDNVTYLQAFIHFAHSTAREALGLDGRFKAGLEAKIAQFGLYEYKRFLVELNRVRNAVMHDNYLITCNEAKHIYQKMEELLNLLININP